MNLGKLDFLHEQDAFFLIDFGELHFDDLVVRCLHRLSNIIGFDRKFPMAPVNQNAKLNELGSSIVKQGVHGRANCPSCIQHVVHEYDREIRDRKMNFRALNYGLGRDCGQVVAVEIDIQISHWHLFLFEFEDCFRQPVSKRNTAASNTDKSEVLRSAIALNNLVRQATQSPLHLGGGHDLGFFANGHLDWIGKVG
jgi:hypothetical protein